EQAVREDRVVAAIPEGVPDQDVLVDEVGAVKVGRGIPGRWRKEDDQAGRDGGDRNNSSRLDPHGQSALRARPPGACSSPGPEPRPTAPGRGGAGRARRSSPSKLAPP